MPSPSASALLLQLLLLFSPSTAQPGFISLDCGGDDDYTDDIGIQWISDANFVSGGQKAKLLLQNQLLQQQYTTVRSFPPDNKPYCYTLNVTIMRRYLVRATFLYGNFDDSNFYPKFDLFLGPTLWTTVVIDDATTPVVQEAIILATAPTLSVCLSDESIGQRFISTLELRQFSDSMYYNTDEKHFFLRLSARINFGAESNASVRYPDDPFDRIWESDLVRRANYLVDVAPGTERISTTKPIFVSTNEAPPERVMQTAVVGKNGYLTYRIDLENFPGNAWGGSYFAEIADLAPNQTRKFKLVIPGKPEFSKPTVDVEENAQGKYRLYEAGYTNVSLPFVFSFGFKKTNDSSEGPILNAMEIYIMQSLCYMCSSDGMYNSTRKWRHGIWDAWTWKGRLSRKKRITIYVIAGISGSFGLFILLIFFIWHKKRYGLMLLCQRASKNAPRIESFLQKQETSNPKRYTLSEVKRMTKSFAHKLGRGGFGTVYKGSLPDGREIAVKMLKDTKGDGEEFINEVAGISKTSHINVVNLLGFSLQGSKRALIYEYMPNGSLDRYSFGDSSIQGDNTLSWDRLFNIIVGIARGLEYLHCHCNIRIVHFDIKPQNILLDQDFCPKISDFGLSKLCHLKESRISINALRGTPGYIAPEVFSRQYGSASSKSDVYSYGMVVLEMAGAKKNINVSTGSSSKYFPQWLYDNLDQFCCPTGEISSQTTDLVRKMVVVGLWCIQLVPTDRPSMREVLEMLESNGRDLPLPPKGL